VERDIQRGTGWAENLFCPTFFLWRQKEQSASGVALMFFVKVQFRHEEQAEQGSHGLQLSGIDFPPGFS
jgi:hypothetical protein